MVSRDPSLVLVSDQTSTELRGEADILIEWTRVAEPQSDQYDTLIVLDFLRRRGYVREDIGSAPTFFDGQVALRNDAVCLDNCVPAQPDHPNINKGCDLIRLWPTVFTQCQLLIESVSPFIKPQDPCDATNGSTCGPGTRGFGTIASTINSYVGFAEAIVHEMGHHKLRALGFQYESAERIIRNPSDQKFKSPIRYDCLRPMPAVLHAQYSYTYVSALDIEIIKAGTDLSRDRRIAEDSLAKILPKLEFGLEVIRDNADTDSAGADFLEGYFAWLNRVLEEGYRILDKFKIPPNYFQHPLDVQMSAARSRREQMATKWQIDVPEDDRSCIGFHDDTQNDSIDIVCTRPFRLKGVEEHSLLDEMVLYIPESDMAFSFNNSTKTIWELCDGRHTIADISQEIGQSLGVFGDSLLARELLSDVIEAITQLHNFGLLELEEATHAKST